MKKIVFIILIFILYFFVSRWLQVDSCLDSGGSFDKNKQQCIYKEIEPDITKNDIRQLSSTKEVAGVWTGDSNRLLPIDKTKGGYQVFYADNRMRFAWPKFNEKKSLCYTGYEMAIEKISNGYFIGRPINASNKGSMLVNIYLENEVLKIIPITDDPTEANTQEDIEHYSRKKINSMMTSSLIIKLL